MNPRVIAHPANLQGRDFIVGDLHGYPDVLRRLMDHVAFDYDTDRLLLNNVDGQSVSLDASFLCYSACVQ
jgi:hypothetical protein